MKKRYYCVLLGVFSLTFTYSCDNFLETELPKDQLSRENVFAEDYSAMAALNGMYASMQAGMGRIFTGGLTTYAGMYADELYYYSASERDAFLHSKLTELQDGVISLNFWRPAYQYIYAANSCLEGISASEISSEIKNIVAGEAYFVRSLSYYYLTELFGDVPLVLSTTYSENEKIGRTNKRKVVEQVLDDLKKASELLEEDYTDMYKNRPNRYAIKALIARISLQNGFTELAFTNANEIIESGVYHLENLLENVFLRESTETIFQLTRINPNINTWEVTFYTPANSTNLPAYLLQPAMVNSFESGDKRRDSWIGEHSYNGEQLFYPNKYRARTSELTEDYVLFRLAEQYLIRAEAALQMGNTAQAISDLNTVRSRSGLAEIPGTTAAAVLWDAILTERRHELFTELGQRWFDLKRLNKADEILGPIKSEWESSATLWMIPWSQIQINPLLTQNDGYE